MGTIGATALVIQAQHGAENAPKIPLNNEQLVHPSLHWRSLMIQFIIHSM